MLKQLVDLTVASVRRRVAQGDCPIEPARSVETLEHALLSLADDNARLQSLFANPPKHDYWMPGEVDCPREIKAGNGELHTLRCRVCGLDNPRDQICRTPA